MGKISISIALLLVIVLAAVIVAAAVSALITYSVHKKSVEKKIGNAEDKAREILDEAGYKGMPYQQCIRRLIRRIGAGQEFPLSRPHAGRES